MSRYRKVDPRMWNDERIRALSGDAKLLVRELITPGRLRSVQIDSARRVPESAVVDFQGRFGPNGEGS